MVGEDNATERADTAATEEPSMEDDEPRYVTGDRVFVRGSRALRVPGVVIGHYVDWNLYRVVYMVDVAGQSPRGRRGVAPLAAQRRGALTAGTGVSRNSPRNAL